MRLLSRNHDLRLLSLCAGSQELTRLDEIVDWPSEIIENRRIPALARSAIAGVVRRPMQHGYTGLPALRRALVRQVASWAPDVVHLNVFRTSHLVDDIQGPAVVLDLDEFRSDYYEQLTRARSRRRRIVGRLEMAPMRRAERKLLGGRTQVLLSAPTGDERMNFSNVHVVRTPVAVPASVLVRIPIDPPRVLFVGRLSYEANVDAITQFVQSVWTTFRTASPGAILQIVGADPDPEVQRLREVAGVEVIANVPDVESFYTGASLAIVPVERATGVQMKLIQALAMNVPAVVSPLVASLGGVVAGREVMVAQTAEDWSISMLRLIGEESLRARLIANGRAWYEANHSPDAVATQLEAVYGRLAQPN
jgi:glycosyltransferase involved in cell wall biosynthesis